MHVLCWSFNNQYTPTKLYSIVFVLYGVLVQSFLGASQLVIMDVNTKNDSYNKIPPPPHLSPQKRDFLGWVAGCQHCPMSHNKTLDRLPPHVIQ